MEAFSNKSPNLLVTPHYFLLLLTPSILRRDFIRKFLLKPRGENEEKRCGN